MKYVDSFSANGSHSTLHSEETAREAIENGGRHLEGRSSGSDVEGYEGLEHGSCGDHDHDDASEMSAFKREPARKSLKTDHLDRWINMQETYSEVRFVDL